MMFVAVFDESIDVRTGKPRGWRVSRGEFHCGAINKAVAEETAFLMTLLRQRYP